MKRVATFILSLSLLILASSSQGDDGPRQNFTNPLIDNENNPDPGVIFYEGNYYAVTTTMTSDNVTNKFPIHMSSNLQNWTLVGHVFTKDMLASWTNASVEYWAPEIHRIGL